MKKIVVVGVGALGSHVVQLLRNVDAEILVVDFDRVEMKNVASQFHGTASVGKAKANALRQSMKFLFKRVVQSAPHRLTEDNVDALLGGADLVIDCLDNAASRKIVQDYCHPRMKLDGNLPLIACLHGALDAAGSFGRVIWSEGFVIDAEGAEGAATCEDGEFLPFIAITAAYIARSAQLFLEEDRKVGWTISPTTVFSA